MSKSIAGITDTQVNIYYAVELNFDSGPLRIWSGTGDRTLEGNTYTGAGYLLSLSELTEVSDMAAQSSTVTLSGLSSEIITYALTEPYQGRVARVMIIINNEAPVEVFGGFMDVMTIEDTPEGGTVSLTVESRLVELERTRSFRYTDENHKTRHPNDTFFSYVSSLQDKEILWGRKER